ncbi:hypothetical protein PC121_g19768 [Phytophthora cactorum]|nr:hypothetical protein PC120_g20074 [Phytophthora cactorum]KAG3047950.1 hypothetical protein PC121_g19768 [Phytophthora cactorum]
MLNAVEENLLDDIATGAETKDASWDNEKKGNFKKKQAKIKILSLHASGEADEPGDDSPEGVSLAVRAAQDEPAGKGRRQKPPL